MTIEPRGAVYDFVFRGLLTEEALDRAGRQRSALAGVDPEQLAASLSIESFDNRQVEEANQMSVVFIAISAFERTARDFVSSVLAEAGEENWWEDNIAEPIRKKAATRRDSEDKWRFHTQRGAAPITYTMMGDLPKIITANWNVFEPFLPSQEWAKAMFSQVERSRDVIMHGGTLDREDIDRLGIYFRDWVKQVGG